jgi:L-malate glycosyltransferase
MKSSEKPRKSSSFQQQGEIRLKVLHVISGGETGGSRKHVVTLLSKFPKETATLVVFQEGPLAKEAREHHIDVRLLPQSSRYDLSVLRKLVELIQNGRYDLLHTHGPRANLYGALIKRKIGIPWMTTIHSDPRLDFMKSGLKGFLFTRLNLWALKKIDYFFAVSERFKDNLAAFGIPKERIKTIYNGIDFNETSPSYLLQRTDVGVNADDFVIAMVARLHPIKGHALVFEALQSLPYRDIKLLVVGDGPLEQELKEKASELQIEDRVKFLGFRRDIAAIYSLSDVALMASYSESFPLALLEAANERIPVISTDVGGVRQLIVSKEMGWIVPVGDSAALTEAIKEAREKKQQLKQMGQTLYEYASSHFSLDRLYEETIATYQHVLEKYHQK